MNEKKWCKLVFKQIQPIHIGMGSYGVVNETRIFIPGWTMWGALTKAYNLKNNKDLSCNQKLFEEISCFYPCFDKEGTEVLFPEFNKGKFHLGRYSEDEFRAKFVDTFVSTAINPGTNTALDESLHELNIILSGAKADYCKDEKEKQLYWVGIVGFKDEEIPNDFLKKNELEIYIGGDPRYGLGKLLLVKKEELEDSLLDDWEKKGGYIPVEISDNAHSDGKAIELLVEIIEPWKKAELKVKLRNGDGFYYIPGSKEVTEGSIKLEKGILSQNNSGDI